MSVNPFKAVSETLDAVSTSTPLSSAKRSISSFMDGADAAKFSDIGSKTRDAMNKDFPVGAITVTNKSKLSDGSSLSVAANRGGGILATTGPVNTDLTHQFHYAEYGADITTKLRSDGMITSNLEFKDLVGKGMKLLAIGTMTHNGKRKLKLGGEYVTGPIFSSGILDMDKQILAANLSYRIDSNILAGGEVAYDCNKGVLKDYTLGAQYSQRHFTVSAHALNSLSVFSVGYWHNVNPKVDAFATATSRKSTLTDFSMRGKEIEVGVKYAIDRNATAKAKANSNGKIVLSYTHAIRPGVKVTVGSSFNSATINLDSRKVGLAIALDG